MTETRYELRWRRSTGELVTLESMNDHHLLAARNKLKVWLDSGDAEGGPAPHCDPDQLLVAIETELASRARGGGPA